ncbi:sensor domain-containing phosphodiesterase [Cellulomonas aerilata]|uniref:EAL domain-containing protein n=1 Tax=Cellulomonas aerilata TaxID=515326 RepID=A0A512DFL2_9CELL|nr:EAL domain-containing protein [Cellulomonas aerilata]GEO35274.1 hypothetical protein CAE01nite_29990 [Cellulomonas aerilata]
MSGSELDDQFASVENLSGPDGYEEACGRLLQVLRRQVGMQVGWTSEFVGTQQVFRFVDAEDGHTGPQVGASTPLNDAYCARVLQGTMPALIPNTHDEPTAIWLDVTLNLSIGSYLGVPLHDVAGVPNGMLCLVSSGPAPYLDDHSLSTARLVAQVLDDLHHRSLGEVAARERAARLRSQVEDVCAGVGRRTVFQPVVTLTGGDVVGAEALTRFDDTSRNPAGWFAAAHASGLGPELELATARDALDVLSRPDGPAAVGMNLSPDVITSNLADVLRDVDPARVVLELTEHAPVRDYERLLAVLAPFRRAGLRVAVDDAGAGYASMSHVLQLRPDILKIDMSLVRNVDADPIRRALVGALVRFAGETGTHVVAEGIETAAEVATLVELGVRLGQGYLLGRPRPWAGSGSGSPDVALVQAILRRRRPTVGPVRTR